MVSCYVLLIVRHTRAAVAAHRNELDVLWYGTSQIARCFLPACVRAAFDLMLRVSCVFLSLGPTLLILITIKRDVVYRMNKFYKAWGAMKSVLRNRVLGINEKKCPLYPSANKWPSSARINGIGQITGFPPSTKTHDSQRVNRQRANKD